ncbi:MAG: carboxypeptidase regulatory-like domain-containing protein, partial [Gemmatimonadota bacterium]|nr:carboxypeptidase regulatory-like domain-containing protein [Gemmatimonadota bacterium]
VKLEQDLGLDITLDAGFLVSGQVVETEGMALEGCWVNFYSPDRPGSGASAVSGPDGSFSLRLVAGDYYMTAQPVKGYFPDSLTRMISLKEDTSVEVVLRPGVRVYGRVTDENGRPLPKVMVHLMPRVIQKEEWIPAPLPLIPGVWDDGRANYIGGTDEGAAAAVQAKAPLGLVQEVVPEPEKANYSEESVANYTDESATVNGTDARGEAQDIGIPEPDMEPSYLDKKNYMPNLGWDYHAWTDPEGDFEIRVRPEVYDLYAWSAEKGYSSVFMAGLECTSDLEVNLTLKTAEVIVDGTVRDEDGAPADSVLVSVYDRSTGSHKAVYTDISGSFRLHVAPGVYEMLVDGTDRYDKADVVESISLASDRYLELRLGTGLVDGNALSSKASLPKAFHLGQNHPNPFNPSTTITYSVASPTTVSLKVFSLRGRLVKTLAQGFKDAGTYSIQWDGADSGGRTASSGVYFYRIESKEFTSVRKMVLLK